MQKHNGYHTHYDVQTLVHISNNINLKYEDAINPIKMVIVH